MNVRHGVPPGYTPPVVHDRVTCWRCGRYLADDPPGTECEVIRVGGRTVTAHTREVVECVPTLYPQGPGVRIPIPAEETP